MKFIQDFYIKRFHGKPTPMHRCYFYLVAFISISVTPFSAIAEIAADSLTADTQIRHWTHTANEAGFYLGLPTTDYNQLTGQIRTHLASLSVREEEVKKYLDEHQLGTKDVLITVIMPGGLIYAAIRKSDLEMAKVELARISADMDEFSGDLLAMQIEANELIVARLQ
jgi:hypothetical protein